MHYQYHDESIIQSLPENVTFVFGSDLAGKHEQGAALTAVLHFGALKKVGRGWSGQSFAIPTLNEHLQQMPLSQIEHYVNDFKTYTKNHPKITYFITSIGCGVAGYKVEEIAPMFKGISRNVIFPESFRPFVEKPLPKLTSKLLHTIFQDSVILAPKSEELIQVLALTDNEKSLTRILLNTAMYPVDSNGRERIYEIDDILHTLKPHITNLTQQLEHSRMFGGVILALLELYNMNEKDFIEVWNGSREISPPKPAHKSKR